MLTGHPNTQTLLCPDNMDDSNQIKQSIIKPVIAMWLDTESCWRRFGKCLGTFVRENHLFSQRNVNIPFVLQCTFSTRGGALSRDCVETNHSFLSRLTLYDSRQVCLQVSFPRQSVCSFLASSDLQGQRSGVRV